jgi:1-hydroxycarotenoid 3,4-desaturase
VTDKVIVIGAGMGGLAAAIDLARSGCDVTVLERAPTPGGKARRVSVGGAEIAGGPTVFTMRWIFDGLFGDAGTSVERELTLRAAPILARHAWTSGGRLDLFADIEQSVQAISEFSNAKDGAGYRAFCARAKDIYGTLVRDFMAIEKPSSPIDLTFRVGLGKLDALWRLTPMKTMWSVLAEHFQDPRLRQLFGRYTTYVGSSPLQTPATLMLIAHVEQDGVWLVDGGMRQVADAMTSVAQRKGAKVRFGSEVKEITTRAGRVTGVALASGERLEADAVVFNGDISALATGLLGADVRSAVKGPTREERSLSAITWCAHVKTRGFPLLYHNVFFADDYPREFKKVFEQREITEEPTVYICAEDRSCDGTFVERDAERLLLLINAPADGDIKTFDGAVYVERVGTMLKRCGLEIDDISRHGACTAPNGFNGLFPASGGALYGRASHGPNATFQRQAAVTRVGGLYCAGGSAHPGPGVPMATLSGRIAAARVLADLSATRGGLRMRGPVSIAVPA